MANGVDNNIYTYRSGKKVILEKSPAQFIVRLKPEELENIGIHGAQQVSSSSSRIMALSSDLDRMMTIASTFAPTHPAYYAADTGKEFLITDRIFITFKEPLPSDQVDAFAGRYGLVKKKAYDDRNYLFQMMGPAGMDPVKLVVTLTENEPLVQSAEHDLNQRLAKYQMDMPKDPAYPLQWHLHTRRVHQDLDPRSSSRCEEAWSLLNCRGIRDVVIGITDDGCKISHADFDSPGKFADWGYFRGERLITSREPVAESGEMYKSGSDHGTCCAGVMAGEADSTFAVGAAPECRLLPIQWESEGLRVFISDSKLLTALEFLQDKIDVMSNSWGNSPDQVFVPQVINEIERLGKIGGRRGKGIVFIWAAGNDNCPIKFTSNVSIPYTDGLRIRGGTYYWEGVRKAKVFEHNLVGVPGVMHVAALSSMAQRSHYSNYGTGIDICAPSNNIHSYYRATLRGIGIVTSSGGDGGITEEFGGTSSAAPLVAGIAALVISANQDLSSYEVISILKSTASKDLNMEGYPRTPPAAYDPDTSWDISPVPPFDSGAFVDKGYPEGTWSPWFGHGKVDAASAVAEAIKGRAVPEKRIKHDSASRKDIPDYSEVGARDVINVAEEGVLASIKVDVDITHPYIGDLRLTLASPSGTSIVLHDRNGGGSKDIKKSFDLASSPALSTFIGQPVSGAWTLLVQDAAPSDAGTLNRWSLEVETSKDGLIVLDESPGVAIPDEDSTGILRGLQVAGQSQVRDIEVSLDITHTFIGDLVIDLISPSGTIINLHNRAGGSADNIIKTYTLSTTPDLRKLQGQPIEGTWQLKIADLERSDVGKLNKWGIKISSRA